MNIKLVDVADVNNPDENDWYLDPVTKDVVWLGADGGIDPAEVAQRIRCRLRFFKGDWFLDEDEGIPYFDEILEKGATDARVQSIIRRVIAGTAGVASVSSLSLQRDNASRRLNVTFMAVLDSEHVLNSDDFGPFFVEV